MIFNPLGREQLEQIAEIQVGHVSKLLAERNISIELAQAAHELLFRDGYNPAYGARLLKRAIQRLIQDPLALQILEGKVLPGDHILVDADRGSGLMVFEHTAAEAGAI